MNSTNDVTNKHHKKQHFFGMNIGSASILLIFVILCLVSFAALSIASANADNKLTRKVLERTSAYYEACNEAEKSLVEIDNTLQRVYNTSSNSTEYFKTVGHNKSYAVVINDSQTLQVTIEFLYPEDNDDSFYRITGWQVITEDAGDTVY